MFILLNGSFGIGKSTAARLLRDGMAEAAISDPEHVGFVLRRLPAWALGLKQPVKDYQDLALWRRLIVRQARLTHFRAKTVIVPMAFTNRGYFDAFAEALAQTAPVRKVCLIAPLEVVHGRLSRLAEREGRRSVSGFERRRSADCVAAHADAAFGEKVDATGTPEEVVDRIRALMM